MITPEKEQYIRENAESLVWRMFSVEVAKLLLNDIVELVDDRAINHGPDWDKIHSALMNAFRYAPDDSGDEWLHPYLWTPAEVNDLVMAEVGVNETSARGYGILIKLWEPDKQGEEGDLELYDQKIRDLMQRCMIGKILRMGKEVFSDRQRFPFGPRFTYGEWAMFKGVERQKVEKDGIMLALVHDDRFVIADKNPKTLVTTFDLERDYFDN